MYYAITIRYKNEDGCYRLAQRYISTKANGTNRALKQIRKQVEALGNKVDEMCCMRLDNRKPEEFE